MIPVVELGRSEVDAAVGEALVRCGFFILEGHGINAALWRRATEAARSSFALPDEIKARYRGPDDGSQRGYLELRRELRTGGNALDRKECWHARRDGHRHDNLFPSEVPELGPAALRLIDAFDRLADRVLAGIDAFLGDTALWQASRGGDSLFRINHYPPRGPIVESAPRFATHRDFDLVTFLIGANAPGLEVRDRDGRWHAVTPGPEAIVVNAGDLLAVASRGRIPSTAHRVINPRACDGGRISMVYFVAPRPEIQLAPGALAGALIDDRLREAGYLT